MIVVAFDACGLQHDHAFFSGQIEHIGAFVLPAVPAFDENAPAAVNSQGCGRGLHVFQAFYPALQQYFSLG